MLCWPTSSEEEASCSGVGRSEKASAHPSPRPHVKAARPVLASPSTPFPFLLGPWQSVTTSPATDVNTCFLDQTSSAAKRVESSGEEEQEQGDGYAPRRSPHEAGSETAVGAADNVRCSEGGVDDVACSDELIRV
jgi:hypothetical protein